MKITRPNNNSILITYESGKKTEALWSKGFVFVLYHPKPRIRIAA